MPVPPISAVKVQGRPLYKLARQGIPTPEINRSMYFYNLQILDISNHSAAMKISCQKGNYIRSWAFAIGEKLGVGAFVSHLKRIESYPYHIQQSMSLRELEKDSADLKKHSCFIPFDLCLSHFKSLELDQQQEKLFLSGQIPYNVLDHLLEDQKKVNISQKSIPIRFTRNKYFLGLIELAPFKKPCILNVFHPLQ